ncbi:MAG: hypothetical protein K2F59_03505 [Eubacteriales bacterium]|nr:hypothetical protein [Eubacteriales bacterium]
MKKLKKIIVSLSAVSILALGSVNVFANNLEPVCVSVHHFNNEPVSGKGYKNVYTPIFCPSSPKIHNKVKIHFYNRTSEPVKVLAIDSMIVEPWSGNSFEIETSRDFLGITVRGLNDNSNQVLNGEISVKSWSEY